MTCLEGSIRQFAHTTSKSMIIEICRNGHYNTICGQSWDKTEASVACAELGFSPIGKVQQYKLEWLLFNVCVSTGAIDRRINRPVYLDIELELMSYQCQGMESSLNVCTRNSSLMSCDLVAAVRCQGMYVCV